MTNVDFYILSEPSIEARHVFACRLTEKAFLLGHRIYIHTNNADQADDINQRLWSFRNSSFIPNSTIATISEANQDNPVLVGHNDQQAIIEQLSITTTHHALMINLSSSVPDFFSQFNRVSEIVVQDSQIKAATRDSYRFYKSRGYPLTDRKIA